MPEDVSVAELLAGAAPSRGRRPAPVAAPSGADIAGKITQLKRAHEEAVKLHAQADASVQMVQQQLAQAEAELRRLGVDPDNAEAELAVAETQLQALAEQLAVEIDQAVAQYKAIIEATGTALGR